jgi:hypothetical protein
MAIKNADRNSVDFLMMYHISARFGEREGE